MSNRKKTKIWWLKPLLAVAGVLLLLFVGVKISTVIWDKYMDPDRTSSTEAQNHTLPVIEPGSVKIPTTPKATESESQAANETESALQTEPQTSAPDTGYVDARETDTEYTGELQVPYTRAPGKYILTGKDFGLTDYRSPHDANGDGIDDQTQFVQGAREFLAKNPQYKSSAYYTGGYPFADAEGVIYGVCTDVIAFAFKAAGYDLMALINADMAAHPDTYIRVNENFDKNINFRRVRNQYCFFKNHAVSLTTDPYKYEEWQPGDIVVTGDPASSAHICMVSTRRAEDGVPYVLQLASTSQSLFEEDYLTTCQLSSPVSKPIYAHFRYDGFNGE